MISHSQSWTILTCIFFSFIVSFTTAGECHREVDVWIEHTHQIERPRTCGQSAGGWCVKTVYKDTNNIRPQGFSKGCDNMRTTCGEIDDPNGKFDPITKCKRDRAAYGNGGIVCCCKGHMCNSRASSLCQTVLSFVMIITLLIFSNL